MTGRRDTQEERESMYEFYAIQILALEDKAEAARMIISYQRQIDALYDDFRTPLLEWSRDNQRMMSAYLSPITRHCPDGNYQTHPGLLVKDVIKLIDALTLIGQRYHQLEEKQMSKS